MSPFCKTMLVVLAVLALGTVQSARADTVVVVPNDLATSEGNQENGFPFSTTGQRYQQVYGSSQFTALGGPGLITQIRFRPDANNGNAFNSSLTDIQINFSTTSASPDGMSATFANNLGANDTIVYARGSLSLSSADTAGPGGTRNFDIVITLTTPFLYDPAQGNLLMDVRNFTGADTTQFDAHSALGDSISRVLSTGGINSSSGVESSLGLVTQFTFQPSVAVPEPATMLLLGTGLAGIAAKVRKSRKTIKRNEA